MLKAVGSLGLRAYPRGLLDGGLVDEERAGFVTLLLIWRERRGRLGGVVAEVVVAGAWCGCGGGGAEATMAVMVILCLAAFLFYLRVFSRRA